MEEASAQTACSRCGTFAELTEALGRMLCDACRTRRAARLVDAEPTSRELLRSTFVLIGAVGWRAWLATALLDAPLVVLSWFVIPPDRAVFYSFAWGIVSLVADGAIVHMAVAVGRDERPRLSRALLASVRRWPVLAATLVLFWLATLTGLIALIIPGIVFACAFGIATAIAMIEDVGPISAMQKSVLRTRGYRWHFFMATLGLGVLAAASYFVIDLATTSATWFALSNSVPEAARDAAWYVTSFFLFALILPLGYLPTRVLPAALYLKLSTDPEPEEQPAEPPSSADAPAGKLPGP